MPFKVRIAIELTTDSRHAKNRTNIAASCTYIAKILSEGNVKNYKKVHESSLFMTISDIIPKRSVDKEVDVLEEIKHKRNGNQIRVNLQLFITSVS